MTAGSSSTCGDWSSFQASLSGSLLRLLRESWAQRGGRRAGSDGGEEEEAQQQPPNALQSLPINVKLYVMSFLSPKDLSYLGSTNRYWRLTVQDPLLWRYFLFRDVPSWHSTDWNSLPDSNIFSRSVAELHENDCCDYMTVYKKCYSCNRRCVTSGQSSSGAKSSFFRMLDGTFFQPLLVHAEPRFAMFGPGLEELDESLVFKMMTSPDVLPLAGIPSRPIHGVGSGVTFHLNGQKFNILTLYSKTSEERHRAREEDTNNINKIFCEETSVDGTVQYRLIEHVKNMCRLIDGFIYVANAEAHKRHKRDIEFARLAAMLDPDLGPPGRPLLVLSCVSYAGTERIPCVFMAHQLQMNLLHQPWMMRDIEIATLAGLLDGIQWLLGQYEHKNV